MNFWRKIVIFHTKYPQKCSRLPPLGSIFLSAPPPNLKSWIRPCMQLYNVDDNPLSKADSNLEDVIKSIEKDNLAVINWFENNQMKETPNSSLGSR